MFADPVKIPVLPLHREFMFPQTRYCLPLSVFYKRAINQEDEFDIVKSISDKINKIIGEELSITSFISENLLKVANLSVRD